MTLCQKIAAIPILVIAVFSANTASAEFPERPVNIVHPWAPGVSMAAAQIVADRMATELNQTVTVPVIEGASGVKAALDVLAKPADGYTIFDGYVAPLLFSPMLGLTPYACEDFTPLYGMSMNGFAVAVRSDEERFTNLSQLIKYMEANPSGLRYGAGADVSIPHMVAALMFKNAGVVARNVPYNETGQAWKDFITGDLDFMIINSGIYKSYSDQLKVLAVLSDRPMSEHGIPGPLPSQYGIDLGIEGLAAVGWNWWVVKPGTPDLALEKLRSAMKAALDDEEVRKQIDRLGYTPLPTSEFSPDKYADNCKTVGSELKAGMDAIEWEKARANR